MGPGCPGQVVKFVFPSDEVKFCSCQGHLQRGSFPISPTFISGHFQHNFIYQNASAHLSFLDCFWPGQFEVAGPVLTENQGWRSVNHLIDTDAHWMLGPPMSRTCSTLRLTASSCFLPAAVQEAPKGSHPGS